MKCVENFAETEHFRTNSMKKSPKYTMQLFAFPAVLQPKSPYWFARLSESVTSSEYLMQNATLCPVWCAALCLLFCI